MKRILSLLLVLAMMLSMVACGAATSEETAAPETSVGDGSPVPEETEAPTTEPTLSAEEILLNSLPERMRQAYEVGLVTLEQLEDLERKCTVGEAIQMLQNAYTLHYGRESKFLKDAQNLGYLNESVHKGWIIRYPAAMLAEGLVGENYENYTQWFMYSEQWLAEKYIWDPLDQMQIYALNDDKSEIIMFGSTENFTEFECSEEIKAELNNNFWALYEVGLKLYDQTTGNKLLELDEENLLHPELTMSIKEVIEFSLRTHNALPDDLALVAYGDVGTYDKTIITPELLEKETTLPEASCESLPAWHGVLVDDLNRVGEYAEAGIYTWGHFDAEICEYDIQAIKEAGFDYIGLQVPFEWLQASNLHLRPEAPDGQLDENRLKKLDQILAWCMKWDIHLDIRCTGRGDGDDKYGVPSSKNTYDFTSIWQALARRYADISNNYLSFTLHDTELNTTGFPGSESNAAAYFAPAVEAIRMESPERCIIADVTFWRSTGKDMAELGVALSVDCVPVDGFTEVKMRKNNNSYLQGLTWPYGGKDAEAILNQGFGSGDSLLEIAELAEEKGLGFMVSGWGPTFLEFTAPNYGTASMRYTDETFSAYIQDMTAAMEEHGFGWCFYRWNGAYGLTYSAPLVQNIAYEQYGNYPMYVDTAMYGWFQKINGIA